MNNYYWTDESIKALWQEILNKINNLNFDDINAQDIIDLQNKIANLQQTVESLETLKNTVDNLSTQQERLNDRINSNKSDIGTLITTTGINADKIESIENNLKDSLPLPTAQEIAELNLNLKTTLFNLQNENLGKYRYLALEEAQQYFDNSNYDNIVYITSQETNFYPVDPKQSYNENVYYFTKADTDFIDINCKTIEELTYYKENYGDRIYKRSGSELIKLSTEEVNALEINSIFYVWLSKGYYSLYFTEDNHTIQNATEFETAKNNTTLYYAFLLNFNKVTLPITIPFAIYFENTHNTIVTKQEYDNNKVTYINMDTMSQVWTGNYQYFGDINTPTFTINHRETPANLLYLIAINYFDDVKFNKIKFKDTIWSIINVGQHIYDTDIDYYYVNFEALIPNDYTNLNDNFTLKRIIVSGVYDINNQISYFKNISTEL